MWPQPASTRIVWPVSIAPYEAVVTVVKIADEPTVAAAEDIYRSLLDAGVEAIIDDRDERPGVKFADAELIGVPYRVTIGPRGLDSGTAELTPRRTMETVEVPLSELLEHLPPVP